MLSFLTLASRIHAEWKRMAPRQTTDCILMVRPATFGPNAETADSNAFQFEIDESDLENCRHKAIEEFDAMVADLRRSDIRVVVATDSLEPAKPDAVFPNNWLTLHEGGRAAMFPLLSKSRRAERRMDILHALRGRFELHEVIDYSGEETLGRFLEGTGSVVLDRENRFAYACRSPRTDVSVLEAFCRDFDFEPIVFDALDLFGQSIYHTNVMLSVGATFVVVCAESIPALQRPRVLDVLRRTDREILELRHAQVHSFTANLLQLHNANGTFHVATSTTAWHSLDADQQATMQGHGQIHPFDLPTIERYGGGSARCMICENFLTPNS